jgi:hypothetical protein
LRHDLYYPAPQVFLIKDENFASKVGQLMSNFIEDQRYDDLLTELSEPAISQRISPVSADIDELFSLRKRLGIHMLFFMLPTIL